MPASACLLPPHEFPALWARIREALAPGGVFAGQLFGTRDSRADDPDLTFHARRQVDVPLDGLKILRLEEAERDGHAFSSPKRWNTFDILAQSNQQAPAGTGVPLEFPQRHLTRALDVLYAAEE
jgi:hypothetical protein